MTDETSNGEERIGESKMEWVDVSDFADPHPPVEAFPFEEKFVLSDLSTGESWISSPDAVMLGDKE